MIRYFPGTATLSLLIMTCLVIGATTTIEAKMQEITSVWASAPKTIDGRIEDWPNRSSLILSEQSSALAMTNDENFLYFLFLTSDAAHVRAIKMAGLTVYVDVKAKKKKNYYLKFTGGPSREQIVAVTGRGDDPSSQMSDQQRSRVDRMPEDQTPRLMCFIEDRLPAHEIHTQNEDGPAVAFDTTTGLFAYEFRIPLAADSFTSLGVGIKPGDEISIGAMWGDMSEMKKDRMSTGSGRSGGRGGMSGGGRRGGMGGGGGMGGRGGKRPQMPKKQEVWVKTTLAESPEPTTTPDE